MPDSSQRIVFTNESGMTLLDFGFEFKGKFKVHFVTRKLDKKPVIHTLRKDFELILGLPFIPPVLLSWNTTEEIFYGVRQGKETAYFITDKECSSLHRLEWGTQQKRKVSVQISGAGYPSPDTLHITHFTFPMQIHLTRIQKE